MNQRTEHDRLRQYRIKLSRLAARVEVKTVHGWARVRSGYLKDLPITAGGKLAGLEVVNPRSKTNACLCDC